MHNHEVHEKFQEFPNLIHSLLMQTTMTHTITAIHSSVIPPFVWSAPNTSSQERFTGIDGGGAKLSFFQSFKLFDDPHQGILQDPAPTIQLLESEDKADFLAISQHPTQTLSPFISILDTDFEVWRKKVSICSNMIEIY